MAASFVLIHRQKKLSVAPLCYLFSSLIEDKTIYPKCQTYFLYDA